MALRTFTDPAGVEWQAWDVRPDESHRRSVPNSELENGWLVFESPSDKRRLCPIPADWETCPAERLQVLCGMASPARTPAT